MIYYRKTLFGGGSKLIAVQKDDLRVHELLVVRASSNISGNIFYKEIDIERGAKITGQLSML